VVANWKARKVLIDYCIGVVDGDEKVQELDLTAIPDEGERARLRASIISDQVKVTSYHFRISGERSRR
jgi:hypothetical protein